MKFVLDKKLQKTDAQKLPKAISMIIFGFESKIDGLNIVFEDKDGAIIKYHIPDTTLGFANDHINDYNKVWVEYAKTDKEYEIELHLD